MAFPSALLLLFVLAGFCFPQEKLAVALADKVDIMGCVLCENVAEAFEGGNSPASIVTGMLKKCSGSFGLMKPVCSQFVEVCPRMVPQ